YANYLVVNNAVLMPVYGQKAKDLLAAQIIKIAFPEHQIITIDCNALIRQHGSLHCMTMQIPS
ncbi:MAG: agmatine deiminase family protein, partial [Muribaculaceae bacterium]|nr:agmatine deiminase family protein [Muribaculaceae bacterium]